MEVLRLFSNLKLALQSFKKHLSDYIAIAFVFSMIVLLGFLVGWLMVGLLIAAVCIVIPAIMIALKYTKYKQ